ncbi:zinc finger and SCAN domain-containing protein 31-like [Contarinia nasturtii]|uniref:zinc finger and SCAN domain-containing protein 31-like n=1 Tax=Contarinia nasturtii TaxID=265458 RepID=UPI0012D4741B|nr:zinc finger and SCAN domain-containing protein 31-like [Contarinia nasturtii]
MLTTCGFPTVGSTPSYDQNFIKPEINGPVEISDTSDEEDLTEMKLELPSPILDDDYDIPPEWDVMEADDDIPEIDNELYHAREKTNKRTSTAVSNFEDGTKGNNMAGTPMECARKRALGSIAKNAPNKKSNSSKPMGTKKRFQCELCAYSSNYKADLKKHTLKNLKMLSWGDEMNQMLTAFEYQAKFSLANIKQALKRNGFTFNAAFKQYFLRVSYDRIKNTYDEFEIKSMFEDESTPATDEYPNSFHTSSQAMNNTQPTTNEPFEIIDTSDEEDEAPKMQRAIRYDGHGISNESNDYGQLDDDGSYTEMSDMKSNVFYYQGDVSSNRDGDRIGNGMDNAMKAVEMERDDSIPIVGITMDTTIQNTSTVKLNNDSNNMTGRSNGRPSKQTESLRRKNSTSSNQMGTKKRFQCQLCEYSSNQKGNFNVHMRTHTGEKPYRCDNCHKEFARMEHLKRHKVSHTDQIPFHCRGCFKGFSQKTEKDGHEKMCKLRRYECHICKKFVTVNKCDLKIHMQQHTGAKPFRCEVCMKCFKRKEHLKKHLDQMHTRKNP